MVQWSLDAERELWRDVMAPKGLDTHPDALWWFARLGWGIDPFIRETGGIRWFYEPVHRPFLRWLQNQIIEWKESRRAGNVELWQVGVVLPRDFGKTVTATKIAMLWMHLDEPNMSTVIGSEVHPKAKDFLKPVKEVVRGTNPYAWFCWLFGQWYDPRREWSYERFEHAYRTATGLSEPSFDTFGVDKGITGYHPLAVVFDDPISRNKLRDTGGAWLKSVQIAHDAVFPAVRKDGFYMLVGNRYLIDDIIGKALADDGVLSWDGMPPNDPELAKKIGSGRWRVYYLQARDHMNTTNYEQGEPVLPCVWSHKRLLQEEARDASDYAAQLDNDPATGEHMPLVKEQVATMRIACTAACPKDCSPRQHLPAIEYATVHCDTAYRTEDRRRKGDTNVIAVWLHPASRNGIVYFDGAKMDATWRAEDFNDELVKTMLELRRRMIRVRVITADKNPGGLSGLWTSSVKQALEGARIRVPDIIEINRKTGKDDRIRAAAALWVEGYVRLLEDAQNRARLEYEMLRVGFVKPRDLSDCSADVFGDEDKDELHWWYRPYYAMGGRDPNEGDYPISPGDEDLKGFGGRIGDLELMKRYDEQHPNLAPETSAESFHY